MRWLVIFLFAAAAVAEVTVTESREARTVTLENDFVRFTVDMNQGARVLEFVDKVLDMPQVFSGQGLFADHVWQQTWPGELYRARYEYEIVARGPEVATVKVWAMLTRGATPTVEGLRLERTMSLRAGSPAVEATVRLVNPTDQVKTVGYWSQHLSDLGPKDGNFFFRPGPHGVSITTQTVARNGDRAEIGPEFVKEPTAGWSAKVNVHTGAATVYLVDYSELRWLYNNWGASTVEWFCDLLRMSPGREWQTPIVMLPLHGYRGISSASRDIVADLRLLRQAAGFRVVADLGCGVLPVTDVTLQLTVGEQTQTVRFDRLDWAPTSVATDFVIPADGPPVTIRAVVTGAGFEHAFARHFHPYNRADHPVAGDFPIDYTVPRPEKVKDLPKPADLALTAVDGLQVFEVRGQFYDAWRLADLKPAEYGIGNFSSNVYGDQLDAFPPGFAEIMRLDAVVLNNIPAAALAPQDMALLEGYVKDGGGLLVLGGWYAFGGGLYAGSPLDALLPVASGRPFDIVQEPAGLPIAWPGVDTAGMVVMWRQQVPAVRDGARVLARAGEYPLVVAGTYGKGRVVVVLAPPCGVAPAGKDLFCESAKWPAAMDRLLREVRGAE